MTDDDWKDRVLIQAWGFVREMTLDELYQAFKARMASEASPDPEDFPLGPACDLSGEGKCEACE